MTEGLSPSRRTLVLLVAPIVVLSVMGTVASAFAPALAAHHPLLLIAFDSRNRMLVLARHVGLAQFILVACTRRMLKVPLSYALGRLYGDSAIRWLEKKGGGGALVRLSEKVFSRAAYPVVFLSPSLIVCALAGVTEMSPVGFLLTALAGTVASVLTLSTTRTSFAHRSCASVRPMFFSSLRVRMRGVMRSSIVEGMVAAARGGRDRVEHGSNEGVELH